MTAPQEKRVLILENENLQFMMAQIALLRYMDIEENEIIRMDSYDQETLAQIMLDHPNIGLAILDMDAGAANAGDQAAQYLMNNHQSVIRVSNTGGVIHDSNHYYHAKTDKQLTEERMGEIADLVRNNAASV